MRSHQTHSSSAVSFIFFLFLLFSPFSFSTSKLEPVKRNPKRKQSVSAILIFGDSTVDPGNNNYIDTIFKSDFPPYGLDFKNKIPTGRFCNGRLATDFIASYLGVKENVPAYLDPNLGVNELITGVSFASAGSGYDPLTPTITNVLDIPTQLEYFKEYKRKLESKMGKERMEKHIEEALFVQFIQGLWKEGARKIVVVGLPPIGCLPIVITLFSGEALTNRRCIDRFSAVATNYNYLLQKELGLMQMSLAGSKILYLDVYNSLYEIIHDNHKFGFEEVSSGCCGSGYLETSFLCNPKSYVCPNTSAYVFFDSIHPSEKTYFHVFKSQRRIYDSIIEL
ncbi:PREDICTED: GDSL esterase/lipase At5g45960-like isoform X2 [Camelina sativa]|uniref:GDSL esterase/lipase At5g45960-like isoform X2 n=1 Tax=Camelina sativa TaxID=90675 RepID=A0ABM1RFR9_CAMSA|nr:PREDICTED: GDSL esterase/lipase At5g45960-like isoform X2 [Camelina sativa]